MEQQQEFGDYLILKKRFKFQCDSFITSNFNDKEDILRLENMVKNINALTMNECTFKNIHRPSELSASAHHHPPYSSTEPVIAELRECNEHDSAQFALHSLTSSLLVVVCVVSSSNNTKCKAYTGRDHQIPHPLET